MSLHAIEDAATRLNDLDHVCLGFHATLNAEWNRVRWGSVSPRERVGSLVQEDGTNFSRVQELENHGPVLEEATMELQAQLDLGRRFGIDFKYADQHMGFGRAIPGFDEAFDRWCDAEGILNYRHYHRRLPRSDDPGRDPVEQLIADLEAAGPGQWAIVGHPGYETEDLQQIGNKNVDGVEEAKTRDRQRRWFMDPRVIAYVEAHPIEPIRYDEAERI